MDKESLSNTESNNGNDGWVESMSEVEPSSEIDFEKRKQEIEALKLDIQKAKLEAERKRAEEDVSRAGSISDPQRMIDDRRMYAEMGAYDQLSYHNPERVADSYETHAWLDNLDDKSIVRESLVGTNDGNANMKRSDATSTDVTDTLNGLANRQSGRYSNYQDAAGKHIDNVLSGIDRKLDIIEKRNPNNSSAA